MNEREIVSQDILRDENFDTLRAREVTMHVLGEHFFNNTTETNKEKLRLTFERKLPLYKDALERGSDVVTERLKTNGVEIDELDGTAVRAYKMDETGLITWFLSLKSSDPFARINFIKDLNRRNQPTAGVSDFWTDRALVEQALYTGEKEQFKEYMDFMKVSERIFSADSKCLGVLPFFPSLRDGVFLDIRELFTKLKSIRQGRDAVDFYISNGIGQNSHLLKNVPALNSFYSEILKLNNLFIFGGESRKKVEASFIIELLTNPQSLKNINHFRNPETTLERIIRVNKFINDLRETNSILNFKLKIGLITNSLIEQNREALNQNFEELKISPDAGFEFFSNLLFFRLQNLPGWDNRDLNKLEPLYHLEMKERRPEPVMQRQTKEPERPSEASRLASKNLLVQDFIIKGNFNSKFFRSLSYNERVSLLNQIFSDPKVTDYERRTNITSLLYKKLMLLFNLFQKKFVPGSTTTHKNFEKDDEVHLSANALLSVCNNLVESGDDSITNAIESLIKNAAMPAYLKSRGFSTPGTINFSRLLSNRASEIIKSSEDFEDIKDKLESMVAGFSLASAISSEVSRSFPEVVGSTLIRLKGELRARDLERRFGSPDVENDYSKELEELTSMSFDKVIQKMEGLIHEFETEYFGEDYRVNRKKYISEILERSRSN